jgi:hypothetical protein
VSVQLCLCGAPVFILTEWDGPQRVLDTEHSGQGDWTLDHDSQHCHRQPTTGGDGTARYRLHSCPPVEQPALFEAGEAG